MTIKGIKHEREDSSTGAPISFHRIVQYVIDERAGVSSGVSGVTGVTGASTALVAGYVSEAKFNEGRNPMGSMSVTVQGLPPAGADTKTWLYEQAIAGTDGPFSGGTPIQA